MAGSAVWTIRAEVTGIGNDVKISSRSAASDVPTQASGPIIQSMTTSPLPVELGSLISGQLIALYVKALTSNLNFCPTASTPLASQVCFIPQGQANIVTYKPTVSAIPFIYGDTALAQAEIWCAGLS